MPEETAAAAETAEETATTEPATTETATAESAATVENIEAVENTQTAENTEDVSYHAVEKEGTVTAIWEMQGQKHLRTIDPRSAEGKQILALFETAG